mmetsp:Transcript_17307/g.20975  ORF Transcript_17307/g.20975 Transcript_17307/m.20975 type:complete len:289 (+) Transcript_17307:139-1005(+)|eukprot:CAMPEP_0184014820 /NCGR_PEP_ID=MMETSP0954-20121128/5924_1 /TAXON_ID=627963 /ORGANISM="Aplanochytrium sp, Strain PBS07" /LENGTH=288 /DNA_ID=CAMNT_0026295449 /DNA_START=129 /DNA_END=995 /DNA_ORIENTATION=-
MSSSVPDKAVNVEVAVPATAPQQQEMRQRPVKGSELKRAYNRMDTAFEEDDMLQFMKFNPEKVARFFERRGIYHDDAKLFYRHQIDGVIAPLLEERHLKEMGLGLLGPRLQILHLLHKIKTGSRVARRNQIVWEGLEYRQANNGPFCPCVPYQFPCCCFLGPRRSIRLTNVSLQVTKIEKEGCCQYSYYALCGCIASPNLTVNSIDLSQVTDINRIKRGKECCKEAQVWIDVQAEDQGAVENDPNNGNFMNRDKDFIIFSEEEGPIFERKLRNAMEENQQFKGFRSPY